ncbi:MAG: shikimate kinase [Henriciella sp.]|mgnify:CR=1 FL=1|uniref:shikimate kinase n=1 Tax=Henriciella sp. TaxID=1968823 RepID=UPI000C119AC5|nr:shikimate kinase [Henriciella sp.]MAN72546.1 shikimate kinase [Henriciella sp.]MBF33084.1 shikimate kinase [Hyphomonadaceae bacterium]MBK74898.1 shikimate kinase [Henriciella sp.]PHR79459.1 MAG: shikimate kinase [Henriciella sp.]
MTAKSSYTANAARIGQTISNRTVALVGLMGAGKSTVGRRLAYALGRQFYDSDDEIEKAAGLSISDIFALHGEAEFRRGEQRVLERLLSEPPHVLATGGGAYLNPDTRTLLREHAITIWLNADLETLWRRVSKRGHRPLLKADNPKGVLSRLLDERAPIYEKADIVVTSREGPHRATVNSILKALDEWSRTHHD